MKFSKLILASTALVLSTNVSAALVGIDDAQMAFLGTPEDGFNITLDDTTGLEWLDWSLTLNRSYIDVFSQTQGGNLMGWRYATASEFESLAIAAGIPTAFIDAAPGGTHAGFEVLNSFLGSGSTDNSSIAISATTLASPTPTHSLGGFLDTQLTFLVPGVDPFSLNTKFGDQYAGSILGSALVREVSAVPIPAAVWLFGSGLLSLVGVARRKTHV